MGDPSLKKELGRWPGRGHHFHTLERSVPGKFESIWHIQTPGKPGTSEPTFEIQRSLRGAREGRVLLFLTHNLVLLLVETMQSKVERVDFHGSPVVNTMLPMQGDRSSVSVQRTKIPQVMWHGQKTFLNVKGCSFVFSGRRSYKSVLFIFLPFAVRLPFLTFRDIVSNLPHGN